MIKCLFFYKYQNLRKKFFFSSVWGGGGGGGARVSEFFTKSPNLK